MNLARVSTNGQITVPIEIRTILGVRPGDKILFSQNATGDIIINNASVRALKKAQLAFSSVAEELGVNNENDVQALIEEVRHS